MNNFLAYLLYGCGSFFLVLGLAITGFWKPLFHNILSSNLVLANGSQTEQVWSKNTIPIYFKVYMFNWTNPVQTLAKKEKANFAEIGPYTFRFTQTKSNIVWNANRTVSFKVDRFWSFVPEMSNGSLSDRITNINAVAMSLGERIKDTLWIKKLIWNVILNIVERRLYVTKTVKELLFQGYRDEVLEMGKFVKNYLGIDFGYLPEKFGWYFKKNASESIFNIFDGSDDINTLGTVHSWNRKTRCHVYSGKCDKVQGSLGELWPKNITEESTASLFISDFCGGFDLTKIRNQNVNGVEGVQFAGTDRTFDNGYKYRENQCFCKNNRCNFPSGIRDVSDCVHGPIYISFPHFYMADESYRRNLHGMNPVAKKHQFSVTFQQDSGIVMEIFARLQINVKVEPYPGLGFFSNLPKMMVPTIWFEEYVEVPDKLKNHFKLVFNLVPNLFSAFGFIFIIMGAVILNCAYMYTQLHIISIDPYLYRI